MNISRLTVLFLLVGMTFAGTGCDQKHAEGDEHDHEETPAGASFKEGTGVILSEEMRQHLGVEVQDVAEQKLPTQLKFSVQVFGEKHRPELNVKDHTGCDVQGSGVLKSAIAESIQVGLPVQLQTHSNEQFDGTVLAIQKGLTSDENEIIVGITNAATKLKSGEFLSAVITSQRDEVVTVVPRSALLQAVDGTFVYAVNGDAYFRTSVKIGVESQDVVEVTDGLFSGDAVVTKSVETLWLIELRASKGGGHSH